MSSVLLHKTPIIFIQQKITEGTSKVLPNQMQWGRTSVETINNNPRIRVNYRNNILLSQQLS